MIVLVVGSVLGRNCKWRLCRDVVVWGKGWGAEDLCKLHTYVRPEIGSATTVIRLAHLE